MITTRKYWIELIQAFFSNENEDDFVILDDYDISDYLQMALETTALEVINGKYKGVSISSMGIWYRDLAVVGKTTVLPVSPLLQDAGIITVNNGIGVFMPRSEGVESVALGILKGQGVQPTYVVDGKNVTWEYPPSFETVDFFMIPMFTELEDDAEFKLAPAVKDIVFTRVRGIAYEKKNFKPDYKNNTNATDGAQMRNGR